MSIDRIRLKPLYLKERDDELVLSIGNVCNVVLEPDEAVQLGHTLMVAGSNVKRRLREELAERIKELRETQAIPPLFKR